MQINKYHLDEEQSEFSAFWLNDDKILLQKAIQEAEEIESINVYEAE